MADAKKMRGETDESFIFCHEALKLSEELGHMGFAAWILRELASLALSKGDTNLAYEHLQKAFQMELERDTRWGVGRSLYDISVYYVYIKEYDTALNYLLIANAIFHQIQHNNISKSEALLAQIHQILGQAKFDQIVSKIDINQSEYKKYFQ